MIFLKQQIKTAVLAFFRPYQYARATNRTSAVSQKFENAWSNGQNHQASEAKYFLAGEEVRN